MITGFDLGMMEGVMNDEIMEDSNSNSLMNQLKQLQMIDTTTSSSSNKSVYANQNQQYIPSA